MKYSTDIKMVILTQFFLKPFFIFVEKPLSHKFRHIMQIFTNAVEMYFYELEYMNECFGIQNLNSTAPLHLQKKYYIMFKR